MVRPDDRGLVPRAMSGGKLSREQIEWGCSKREAGWSTQRIAMKLGVSSGAVAYHCLKNGAFSPRQRRHETPAQRVEYQRKDGRVMRTFTPEEDEQLLSLARAGKKRAEIMRIMSRGGTSISMRLMLLELRSELPA